MDIIKMLDVQNKKFVTFSSMSINWVLCVNNIGIGIFVGSWIGKSEEGFRFMSMNWVLCVRVIGIGIRVGSWMAKSEGIPNPEPLIWYLVFGMTFSSHDVECMAESIQRDIVSFILAVFSKNDKVRKSISLRQLW